MANIPEDKDANDNDEDAWDELCINPQRLAMETGKQEGTEAGLAAGFRDGFAVGIVKGVEYGMEAGFIRGVLQEVALALSSGDSVNMINSSKRERIQRTVQTLTTLLDTLPSMEASIQAIPNNTAISIDNENDDEEELANNTSSSSDVVGHMQQIRSKFKLLTVQLGLNNFSLKDIMDHATKVKAFPSAASESGQESMPTNAASDW